MLTDDEAAAVEAVIDRALMAVFGSPVTLHDGDGARIVRHALATAVASGRLTPEQAGAAVGIRAALEHRALTRDGAEWKPLAAPLTVAAVGEHFFRAVLVSGSPQGHPGPCPDVSQDPALSVVAPLLAEIGAVLDICSIGSDAWGTRGCAMCSAVDRHVEGCPLIAVLARLAALGVKP